MSNEQALLEKYAIAEVLGEHQEANRKLFAQQAQGIHEESWSKAQGLISKGLISYEEAEEVISKGAFAAAQGFFADKGGGRGTNQYGIKGRSVREKKNQMDGMSTRAQGALAASGNEELAASLKVGTELADSIIESGIPAEIAGQVMPRMERRKIKNSGRERTPSVNLQEDIAVRQAEGDPNAGRDAAIEYLQGKIPNPTLADLQLKSGGTAPSEGVIITPEGQVISQSSGARNDHFVPFNMKTQANKLPGNEFVRTRTSGGLTEEDIAAAVHTGASRATVVSNSGVFSVEFSGASNQKMNAAMIKDYGKLLDSVKNGQLERVPVPPEIKGELLQRAEREFNPALNGGPEKAQARYEELINEYKKSDNLTQGELTQAQQQASNMAPRGTPQYNQAYAELVENAKQAKADLRFSLDGNGYAGALEALKERYPYQISNVDFTARGSKGDMSEFTGVMADRKAERKEKRTEDAKFARGAGQVFSDKTDGGYVMPRYNNPEEAMAGYYDDRIAGNSYGREGAIGGGKHSAAFTSMANHHNNPDYRGDAYSNEYNEKNHPHTKLNPNVGPYGQWDTKDNLPQQYQSMPNEVVSPASASPGSSTSPSGQDTSQAKVVPYDSKDPMQAMAVATAYMNKVANIATEGDKALYNQLKTARSGWPAANGKFEDKFKVMAEMLTKAEKTSPADAISQVVARGQMHELLSEASALASSSINPQFQSNLQASIKTLKDFQHDPKYDAEPGYAITSTPEDTKEALLKNEEPIRGILSPLGLSVTPESIKALKELAHDSKDWGTTPPTDLELARISSSLAASAPATTAEAKAGQTATINSWLLDLKGNPAILGNVDLDDLVKRQQVLMKTQKFQQEQHTARADQGKAPMTYGGGASPKAQAPMSGGAVSGGMSSYSPSPSATYGSLSPATGSPRPVLGSKNYGQYEEGTPKRVRRTNAQMLADGDKPKKLREAQQRPANSPDYERLKARTEQRTAAMRQIDDAMKPFNSKFVGQPELRDYLEQAAHDGIALQGKIEAGNVPEEDQRLPNAIFMGPPGTGKTTGAKELLGVLQKTGSLPESATFERLTPTSIQRDYAGQSANAINQMAASMKDGGVIMMDEAHQILGDSHYASQVRDALMDIAEERPDIVVVLSGYEDGLKELIAKDPGLKSRFPQAVEFKQMDDAQLLKTAKQMYAKHNIEMTPREEADFLRDLDQRRQEQGDSFGNAREVRNMVDASISQRNRAMNEGKLSYGAKTLRPVDPKARPR